MSKYMEFLSQIDLNESGISMIVTRMKAIDNMNGQYFMKKQLMLC